MPIRHDSKLLIRIIINAYSLFLFWDVCRFEQNGWKNVNVWNMTEVYASIPETERKRYTVGLQATIMTLPMT